MRLIETSQTIRTIILSYCQAIDPEGMIDSIKKSPRYVLEMEICKRIEGFVDSHKSYNFHKVGNQLRLKVKGDCNLRVNPKTCGSGCAICEEREDVYHIE